jgi:hypothetical protein
LSDDDKPSLSIEVRVKFDEAASCGVVLSAGMIRVLRRTLPHAVKHRFTTMALSGFCIRQPPQMRELTPWTFRRSAVDPCGRPRRRCSWSAESR